MKFFLKNSLLTLDLKNLYIILGIDIHVHVTPYQIKDSHRPWIGKEESRFCDILQSMKIPIKRTLHFADKTRSLQHHFNILKAIGSYAQ